jgi:hypothetical protein
MSITIKNQARHLLICTLNSGRAIYLAPAETSEPVEHLEINGNEKMAKLARAGLVSIATKDLEQRTPAFEPNAHPPLMKTSEPVDHLGINGYEKSAKPAEASFVSISTNDSEGLPRASVTKPRVWKPSLSRFQFLIFAFVILGLCLLLSIQAVKPVYLPTKVLGLLGLSAGSPLLSKAMNSG